MSFKNYETNKKKKTNQLLEAVSLEEIPKFSVRKKYIKKKEWK